MNRAAIAIAPALAVLGLGACRPIEPDTQRVVVKDDAMLCMGVTIAGSDGGHAEIRAGETLPVIVRSLGCLSNRCATKRQATCSAKREGNRIVVTSELAWNAPGAIEEPCHDACSMLDATCSIEPLQPGTYTVVHGARTTTLEVPSEIESGCVDRAAAARMAAAPLARGAADADAAVSTPSPNATLSPALASAAAAAAAPPPTGAASAPPAPTETICAASVLPRSGKAPKTAPLGISVARVNRCVGASCSAGTPKCTAKRQGARIVVNATFPGLTAKPRLPCTEDCRPLAAICRTEPLPSGTYTIEVGEHTETFELPTQSACKP